MEEEVNLENTRYKPQHPLPEEIRKMRPDDTVCHFCGVSYLIHSEIKSLQEKLEECKNEVERLKHYDEREKGLNDQLDTLNIKWCELLEKWEIQEKRNNEYEDLILEKNVYISQLKQNLEINVTNLNSIKSSNEDLKHQVKEIAAKVGMSSNRLRGELSKSDELYQYDFSQFMDYWNKQKARIIERVSHFVNLNQKSEERNKQFKTEMDCQSLMYERQIKEADMKCANQQTILKACSRSIQDFEKKIRICITQFSEIEKKNMMLCEKYCKKIVSLNKKAQKLSKYLKVVKDNQSCDRKSLMESVTKYKEENFQLTDERTRMIKSHQHQIQQLHDSFREKLVDAEMWPGKFDEKVKELQGRFNEEKSQLMQEYTESLSKTVSECDTECNLLNKCKEKLKQDVKKLDEKLKMQQRKFNDEKSQLLKEVTESYEKAASVTEERYNQMNQEKAYHIKTIRNLEQHLECMQVKFHGEMLKQVEQHEKEKKCTVASFEHKIFELKKQLNEENISNKEKETIGYLEAELSNAKDVITEKQSCIEECKIENSSLRDCVRRECEERFELTEALASARTELLSMQRFSNKNYSAKQFSSHSHTYNQHGLSANKLSEVSKPNEKNVRLVELSKTSGNLDASKFTLGTLPTSPRSVKSQNHGRTSSISSRYPKNKLKISLNNNNNR